MKTGMLARLPVTALVFIAMIAVSGCDDPFYPRPPSYSYTVEVTGLENFTSGNGTAVIMLPIPGKEEIPLITSGWVPGSGLDSREKRHGTVSVTPVNTSVGPMLSTSIVMTDYYESYVRATPIAIQPGQDTSALPAIVPDVIHKPRSFEDVYFVASSYTVPVDDQSGEQGRQAVIRYLEAPLLPAGAEKWNYTTYVYIDPELKPLADHSSIQIKATLLVTLNHNKVNASEEGLRRYEFHTYAVDQKIPNGVTGFVPVEVRYTYSTGL